MSYINNSLTECEVKRKSGACHAFYLCIAFILYFCEKQRMLKKGDKKDNKCLGIVRLG